MMRRWFNRCPATLDLDVPDGVVRCQQRVGHTGSHEFHRRGRGWRRSWYWDDFEVELR